MSALSRLAQDEPDAVIASYVTTLSVGGRYPVSDYVQAYAFEDALAGVAHGRNVWGRDDPEAVVSALRLLVHPVSLRAGSCG